MRTSQPSAFPLLKARAYLDNGFAYEQAGLASRAISAYEAALAVGADRGEQAEAHLRLGRVYRSLSDWDVTLREIREAVRLADEVGSDDLAAEAMNVEVGVHQLRGAFEAGEALAVRALARARSPRVRGIVLQNRAAMAAQRQDFGSAERLFTESVAAFQEAGYELGMAIALNNASAAARDAGNPERAVELALQAAEIARRIGALDMLLLAEENHAHALVKLGRPDEAEAHIIEALGYFGGTRNDLRRAECLEIMGMVNALRPEGRSEAVRCFELARSLADQVGASVLAKRLTQRLASAELMHPADL